MSLLRKIFLTAFGFSIFLMLMIGFYLSYLYTHRQFQPEQFKNPIVQRMAVELSSDQIDKDRLRSILNQKFSYLGFGKQMTVYESEDRLYVIKFFNPRPPLKKEWFHSYKKIKYFCTFKWLSRAYFKRKERLHKIFKRHALAFNELRDETALVYVHLNRLTAPNHLLEVVDQNGSTHFLNLDEAPFALQRKVTLAGHRLRQLASQNNLEEINKAFEMLQRLFAERSNKKFTDRIQTLNNNYGFLDDRAIQIDFGRIWKDENLNADEETERILNQIRRSWPLFRY